MTDDGPGPNADLVEAMKRLKRDVRARRDAVPATAAYAMALAAEERSERAVMDLARRAWGKVP